MQSRRFNTLINLFVIGLFFVFPLAYLVFEYLTSVSYPLLLSIVVSFATTYFILKKFNTQIEWKIKIWQLTVAVILFLVPNLFWNVQNGWLDAEGNFYSESDRTQHVSYVNQLLVSKNIPINDPYMQDKKVVYSLSPELVVAFFSKVTGASPYDVFKIIFPFSRFIFIILILNAFSSISTSKKNFLLFLVFSGTMAHMASFAGWVSWTIGHITFLIILNMLIQKDDVDVKKIGFLNGVMAFQYLPLTILFSFAYFIYLLKNKNTKNALIFTAITLSLSLPWLLLILSNYDNYISEVNPVNLQTMYRFGFFIFWVLVITILFYRKRMLKNNLHYLIIFALWGILSLFKVHWISISLLLLISGNLILLAFKKSKWAEIGMLCVLLEVIYMAFGTKMFYAVKLERMYAFVLVFGLSELFKEHNKKKISVFVISMFIVLGSYHLYGVLKESANAFVKMDFTEDKVSKYDIDAYNWINNNQIESKTFIVSYYKNFVFCPLSALTKNNMYYCSKMIAITQGYDYSGYVETIESLKENPEKISGLEGIDYIFISSDNIDEYSSVINYCHTNNSCEIVYSNKTEIIKIT
ncbi:MAG: hypothetical protein PHW96_01365 [Candidatus Nanoarchaeia archaeon]|nr:hypothetical protein [Candidatus Nanoarchaeia archaeon]